VTATPVATSTQKVAAMGMPPGLLLNVRLRRYADPDAKFNKTTESAMPSQPAPYCRFTTMPGHRAPGAV
jgi:hypothetical protein